MARRRCLRLDAASAIGTMDHMHPSPTTRSALLKAILLLATLSIGGQAPAQNRPPSAPVDPRTAVLQQLRSQPIGEVTLKELCPSDEFLGRVADRIIRMDYPDRYRTVLAQVDASQLTHKAKLDATAEPRSGSAGRPLSYLLVIAALMILIVFIRLLRRKTAT